MYNISGKVTDTFEQTAIECFVLSEGSVMNAQVTVDLPEDVLQRATRLAQLTSRKLSDVLVDALDLSLPALGQPETNAEPLTKLSDKAILALTQLEMSADSDSRLSDLLYKQQAGLLLEAERMEMARLMQIYQEGLLRKAQALAEAVRRGLRPSLPA